MNDSRNNTLIIAIVGVLIAVLVAMCACMFGLAVGVGIGQARTRAQIENFIPVVPELRLPATPVIPDSRTFPEMPDLDQMLDMMGGAMVGEVIADGPADHAGIEQGDLIMAVDGEAVTADNPLADIIRTYAPGDEVTITVFHMGLGNMNQEDIVVTLGANPDDNSMGFLGVRVVPFFPNAEPGSP